MNQSNTCLFFTTLYDNLVSEKRRNNLTAMCDKQNIKYEMIEGPRRLSRDYMMYVHIRNLLVKFRDSNEYEYGIICDDDTSIHTDLFVEANKTIDVLPNNWRALHMGPGWLWGRKFGITDDTKNGLMNPEGSLEGLDLDVSKRFFKNIHHKIWIHKRIWLGGSIAFILRHQEAANFIIDYDNTWNRLQFPNDRLFLNMQCEHDYICAYPLLCYEDSQGGTTFTCGK